MIPITICPTCGSPRIQHVQKDFTDKFQGQCYTVPMVEFYECPDCGEKLYDRTAMRKIEAYSPEFATKQRRRNRPSRRIGKKLVNVE